MNNPLRYIDPSGHQAGEVPDWELIQTDDGVYWAYGDDKEAAIAGGANVVGPDDYSSLTEEHYGQWSPGADSAFGDGGGFNQVVSSTTQNPNTVIANGASAAPTLPGGTTAGVGSTTLPNTLLDTNIGCGSCGRSDSAESVFFEVSDYLHVATVFASSGVVFGAGLNLVVMGATTSPTGIGIGIAVAGAQLMVAGALGMGAAFIAGREMWQKSRTD